MTPRGKRTKSSRFRPPPWHPMARQMRSAPANPHPPSPAMRLENKSIFVTGGASGMGRAAAEAFCREGAQVAVADLSEEAGETAAEAARAAGGDAFFVRCD